MGDDQKLMKKRLKVLMNLPENQVCSDCTERQPRWASLIVPPPGAPPNSLPIGAFCCLECSGSHRRLGVHISFVRSINLDSWKEKEVLAMENGGNAKVNAIFEANFSGEKPTNHADLQTRERFIRDKYERRKFYDPAGFEIYAKNAAAAKAQSATKDSNVSLDDLPLSAASREFSAQSFHSGANSSTSSGGGGSSVGPPSAAARRRLEARKIERADTGSSTQARAAPKTKAGNMQRIKSANSEPDLLDFSSDEPQRGVNRNKSPNLMEFSDEDEKASRPKLTKKKSKESKAKFEEEEFVVLAASSNNSGQDFGDFKVASTSSKAPAQESKTSVTSNAAPNKKSAQDIMSLYNTSAASGVQGSGTGMNNPMLTSSLNNQHLAQMTAMMQQMHMRNSGSMQQQQAQQALMYQQHMMRLQMQASMQAAQPGIIGGGAANPMMGIGGSGGVIPVPPMLLSQSRQRPASMTSDGKTATSNNGDADPFASLSGRQGFR